MFASFKEFFSIALPLSGLILFTACGKAANDKSPRMMVSTDPQTGEVDQTTMEQQPDEGIYKAVFKPLNSALSGETTGTIEVRIEGDDFFSRKSVLQVLQSLLNIC